ncbi:MULTISPECIES: fluoride efflux transporter CrcB [Microvirga]|jgi:CrcB protein|uniref:fluoride efflux transporter CrcB n=1 Tax=Microvirga TaxID=186650 RepID=UPI0021C7BE88|nr:MULTISPECIES: fluoride efflux transporter CrcB [unclassified Microvirga]
MKAYFLVFLGAGIGGALRHGVNLGCARYCGTAFPWGTLTVNVVGSFIMGLLAGWLAFKAGENWSQPLRLFLTTGILGGFTTFSAFSLDAVLIWERGQAGIAATYVIASVILSIAGLAVGLGLIRAVSA